MVKEMKVKNLELSKHFSTIKQAAFDWGKKLLKHRAKHAESYERAHYGSSFNKLGI